MKVLPIILAGIMVLAAGMFPGSSEAGLPGRGGEILPPPYAAEPVCCVKPAPPVNVTICVKDPVTCCTYLVDVCVPAECACEMPCLETWRRGIFGRKVLTYTWPCCGHCVEVVITKHGKTIVR